MTAVGGAAPTPARTLKQSRQPSRLLRAAGLTAPAGKAIAVPSRNDLAAATIASLLVVDDDPNVRNLLPRLLERDGYAVACAASGADALELLRDFRPDLVILDWMMPGLDGAEVLRRMVADAATAAVPVIVYTASNDPGVEREAMRLGARACVQKLGRTADLREQIECCLNSARLAAPGDQCE